MDTSSLMHDNKLPAVESTSCCNIETTATEQPVEIPSGDSSQKCHLSSEENDTSATPQVLPINQEEFCTKTTCEQSSTQHTMPTVHPELSMPNHTNLNTILFTGQTPANTLNTKLAGLFTIPTPCVGLVKNPLTFVAPIGKGVIQPTAVASTNIPMESTAVRLANVCGTMPIALCSLPTKLSSSGPSYKPSYNKALPSSTAQANEKHPIFTNTETAPSTTVPSNLNNSSTPGSELDMNFSQQQALANTESCTATVPDSQCITTSTENQATRPSIADTPSKQGPVASVTSQPEQLTENTTLPVIPEFQSGKVDAKKFRPRYYDINSLEIGTWRYQRKMFSRGKSRLKVIFSQRKFVYEFQLNSNAEELACIEIPFRTVVGLNISTSPTVDVVIEVDTVPAMWQGAEVLQRGRVGVACSRVQYNTSHTVDLTDGQLSRVPYHKLTISSTSVSIRNHLMKFDPRFSALLRIPVKIDSNKPPPAALKPEKSSKRKKGDLQDSTSEEPSVHDLESNPKSQRFNLTNESLKVCCCTSGCTSKRCSCIKECRKCQGCSCSSCNNPLNILEEFGVNVAEACNDSCLMQNLPKINNLRALLRNSTVATPCCDSLIPLSSCCTGEVECPECDAEYRFSWCSRDLCDEEDRPRNHCAICQTCRDYRDQHCSRCNRCYFAGSYDFPCPCRGGNQRGGFSFMF